VTCEKITYFIEKGYLTQLNISEKLQVKLHSAYCKCCKNYPKDSEAINRMLARLDKTPNTATFTAEEKKELKEALLNLDTND